MTRAKTLENCPDPFMAQSSTVSDRIDIGLKRYYESLNKEYEITENNGGKFKQYLEAC